MTRTRVAAVAAVAMLLTPATAVPAAAVDVAWNGPTLSVAWDGSARATAEQSFLGVPVAVPGDRAQRGLLVRNDGPTGGTLRAWVTQVDLLTPQAGLDDDFYDDLRLDWSTASGTGTASFAALADAGDTLIAQTHLAQGASTRLEVAYELPVTATSGNRAVVGAREASFVVRVRITGDTPATAPTAPAPTSGAVDVAPGASTGVVAAPGAGLGAAGALALTGLDVLRGALLAVVGIGLGSLLVGAARRRREVQNAGGSGSAPSAG